MGSTDQCKNPWIDYSFSNYKHSVKTSSHASSKYVRIAKPENLITENCHLFSVISQLLNGYANLRENQIFPIDSEKQTNLYVKTG